MKSAARTGGAESRLPLALSVLCRHAVAWCLLILQCESDVLEQEAPCSDWGVMVDYSVRWIAEIHFS